MTTTLDDIATGEWVHPPRNPAQRQQAERDFRRFCDAYFPQTFHLPWSDDHLKVMANIEQAVLEGGLFAMAMPRASGKTSLCAAAGLWASLYGHRKFVVLICVTKWHAEQMLQSIVAELRWNEHLESDFSEACGPMRALEGIHQRARGQLYYRQQTHIRWNRHELVLPTLSPLPWPPFDGAAPPCCGAVIQGVGISGDIRGMKHERIDGTTIRPELALMDDAQTREIAGSGARVPLLPGGVLGLAGPGREIAGLMTWAPREAENPGRGRPEDRAATRKGMT